MAASASETKNNIPRYRLNEVRQAIDAENIENIHNFLAAYPGAFFTQLNLEVNCAPETLIKYANRKEKADALAWLLGRQTEFNELKAAIDSDNPDPVIDFLRKYRKALFGPFFEGGKSLLEYIDEQRSDKVSRAVSAYHPSVQWLNNKVDPKFVAKLGEQIDALELDGSKLPAETRRNLKWVLEDLYKQAPAALVPLCYLFEYCVDQLTTKQAGKEGGNNIKKAVPTIEELQIQLNIAKEAIERAAIQKKGILSSHNVIGRDRDKYPVEFCENIDTVKFSLAEGTSQDIEMGRIYVDKLGDYKVFDPTNAAEIKPVCVGNLAKEQMLNGKKLLYSNWQEVIQLPECTEDIREVVLNNPQLKESSLAVVGNGGLSRVRMWHKLEKFMPIIKRPKKEVDPQEGIDQREEAKKFIRRICSLPLCGEREEAQRKHKENEKNLKVAEQKFKNLPSKRQSRGIAGGKAEADGLSLECENIENEITNYTKNLTGLKDALSKLSGQMAEGDILGTVIIQSEEIADLSMRIDALEGALLVELSRLGKPSDYVSTQVPTLTVAGMSNSSQLTSSNTTEGVSVEVNPVIEDMNISLGNGLQDGLQSSKMPLKKIEVSSDFEWDDFSLTPNPEMFQGKDPNDKELKIEQKERNEKEGKDASEVKEKEKHKVPYDSEERANPLKKNSLGIIEKKENTRRKRGNEDKLSADNSQPETEQNVKQEEEKRTTPGNRDLEERKKRKEEQKPKSAQKGTLIPAGTDSLGSGDINDNRGIPLDVLIPTSNLESEPMHAPQFSSTLMQSLDENDLRTKAQSTPPLSSKARHPLPDTASQLPGDDDFDGDSSNLKRRERPSKKPLASEAETPPHFPPHLPLRKVTGEKVATTKFEPGAVHNLTTGVNVNPIVTSIPTASGGAVPASAEQQSIYGLSSSYYGLQKMRDLLPSSYKRIPLRQLEESLKQLRKIKNKRDISIGRQSLWDTWTPPVGFKVEALLSPVEEGGKSILEQAIADHKEYIDNIKTQLSNEGGRYEPEDTPYYFMNMGDRIALKLRHGETPTPEQTRAAFAEHDVIQRDLGLEPMHIKTTEFTASHTKEIAFIVTRLGADLEKNAEPGIDSTVHDEVYRFSESIKTLQPATASKPISNYEDLDKQMSVYRTMNSAGCMPPQSSPSVPLSDEYSAYVTAWEAKKGWEYLTPRDILGTVLPAAANATQRDYLQEKVQVHVKPLAASSDRVKRLEQETKRRIEEKKAAYKEWKQQR
ncbi:MAG: hypothetical protein K0R48_1086, partial [Gammaproteobacteria bacterium]|nr:hypothetical protein [Gammaproteobacteria bacterium]